MIFARHTLTVVRFRLTADKREIKDFPKLPAATSFIRDTLAEIHSARALDRFL
jgi:hypothetical protein